MGLKREVLRGQAIVVGDREIVPEAVVWSWQRKDVAVRDATHAAGWGVLWAWARPTAVFDRASDRTYRVAVIDRNRQLELWLLVAAVLLPILLNAVAALLRPARRV